MKSDFDAKVEAIREAHRAQIAEETRILHSKLTTDLQEAQAQAAKEYSNLMRAKAANIREMEALRLARAQLNEKLRRYAAMGDIQAASDNDGTNMDDSHHDSTWDNLRPIDFQKAAITDGTVRYGIKRIRCHVCGLNQPDYQVEKAQCHAACLCCGIRTPHMRCVASDVMIHQAQLNVQRATTVQMTTGRDTGYRNRWSTVVTSVNTATSSINEGTTATSSRGILVKGDTHSQPVRKSPRLQERDDDEVDEVPPPKV
jgi:hypothetical protein